MYVLSNKNWHFKRFLWTFGHFKVPLIGRVKPKLIDLSDRQIVVKIPYRWRNKNHLKSMYFGALCIGADVAGGFHGLYHAKKSGENVSLAFKSFEANFIKRPDSDVYFVSQMGDTVQAMIRQAKAENRRVNEPIVVKAYNYYPAAAESVAEFSLVLSLKII